MPRISSFIKFDKVTPVVDKKKELRDALEVDVNSITLSHNNLLQAFQKDNFNDIKELALLLKQSAESIISKIPTEKSEPAISEPTIVEAPKIPTFSGAMSLDVFNLYDTGKVDLYYTNQDRQLDNGGLAPKKEWKSITELELDNTLKTNLVEEMRKMSQEGKTVSKFHHKLPLTIEEFTEPFVYLENKSNYNGPFLVSLLKSEIEINTEASRFHIDLSNEKQKCLQGDILLLSIYDISGSSSAGEEKRFLAVLNFDKLNGVIEWKFVIFPERKNSKLSNRQINEIDKLCTAKKILLK